MIKKVICTTSALAVIGASYLSAQTNIVWSSDFDAFANQPKLSDGSDLPEGFNALLISLGGDSVPASPGPRFDMELGQSIIDNHVALSSTNWITSDGGYFYDDVTVNSYTGTAAAGQQAYMFLYDTLDLTDLSANWILVTNPAWVLPSIPGTPTPGPGYSFADPGLQIIIGQEGSILAANPIPEPSTYALIFGLGILGFLGYRRIRK